MFNLIKSSKNKINTKQNLTGLFKWNWCVYSTIYTKRKKHCTAKTILKRVIILENLHHLSMRFKNSSNQSVISVWKGRLVEQKSIYKTRSEMYRHTSNELSANVPRYFKEGKKSVVWQAVLEK